MIYLPQRALFIHIPRTGGNSITNAMASTCAGNNIDIVVGMCSFNLKSWGRFQRHIRACILQKFIEEWDDIFKFAIYRPEQDRLESGKRLVQRDINNKVYDDVTCQPGWKNLLLQTDKEREKYWNGFKSRDWDFYTKGLNKEDIGIVKYNFSDLQEKWPEICEKCSIPQCELPHLNSA